MNNEILSNIRTTCYFAFETEQEKYQQYIIKQRRSYSSRFGQVNHNFTLFKNWSARKRGQYRNSKGWRLRFFISSIGDSAIDRAVAAPMRNEWALYLDDSIPAYFNDFVNIDESWNLVKGDPLKWHRLHARTRPGGSNLTLERLAIKIWWQGYSGMKLRNLKPNRRTMSSFPFYNGRS
jgi:hypothetical protein